MREISAKVNIFLYSICIKKIILHNYSKQLSKFMWLVRLNIFTIYVNSTFIHIIKSHQKTCYCRFATTCPTYNTYSHTLFNFKRQVRNIVLFSKIRKRNIIKYDMIARSIFLYVMLYIVLF